jgi:hypothetical protein
MLLGFHEIRNILVGGISNYLTARSLLYFFALDILNISHEADAAVGCS